jgi:hypothetical protein
MTPCPTLETLRSTYMQLLATYNARLTQLAQEVGFPQAEERTNGLRRECIDARTAFHDHQMSHRCEVSKDEASASAG